MTTQHTSGPWNIETLGHTVRVIDAEGNDLFVVGDCLDPLKYAIASRIVACVNACAVMADPQKGITDLRRNYDAQTHNCVFQIDKQNEYRKQRDELAAALRTAESKLRYMAREFANPHFTDRYGDGLAMLRIADHARALLAKLEG